VKLYKPINGVSSEFLSLVKGKIVESVREIRNPIAPGIVLWQGETVDGYFRVMFTGGAVMMMWDEREDTLKFGLRDGAYVGMTKTVADLMKEDPSVAIDKLKDISVLRQLHDEAKLMSFKDVMTVLKWKYKNRKVKVEIEEF